MYISYRPYILLSSISILLALFCRCLPKVYQSAIFSGTEKCRFKEYREKTNKNLCSFSTDSSCELDVLGHDGDSLGVNGTQVGIFEKTNKVSLAGFLKSHDSRALESEISFEVLSDFSHKPLEWQLADQKLGALLVTTDLSECDSSWPVSVWFLDTTSCRCGFSCSLGRQLFSGSFSSGTLTSGLFGSCHFQKIQKSLATNSRINVLSNQGKKNCLYTFQSKILTLVDTSILGYLYRVRSRILRLVDTSTVGYLYRVRSRILTPVDTSMFGYLYSVRNRILTLVDTSMVGYLYRVRSRILTLVDSNLLWSYTGLLGRTKKF